jgi:hypothetical protein
MLFTLQPGFLQPGLQSLSRFLLMVCLHNNWFSRYLVGIARTARTGVSTGTWELKMRLFIELMQLFTMPRGMNL